MIQTFCIGETIVVEMGDHLIAIEGPLYYQRTASVVQSVYAAHRFGGLVDDRFGRLGLNGGCRNGESDQCPADA
ncbi:MAG: hypothetical protein ACXWW4_08210 [Candidatus Binatia bacterium]